MVSYSEIENLLVTNGVNRDKIFLLDEKYLLSTPKWITNDLHSSLNSFLIKSGITYVINQFDCNKFSKTASTIADWCWAKTLNKEAALAFGTFAYATESHMINIAIHRNKDGLYVAFYEPQPVVNSNSIVCLTPVILSKRDIQSCILCLFQ